MRILTGVSALLATLWSIIMLGMLSGGTFQYPFPHRFAGDIDSPVLAIELARERSEADAVLHRNDPNRANAQAATRALRLNTVLDLVFIPLYALYLILLARLSGNARLWVLAAIIGAGIFDYVEDILIFSTMAGNPPIQFIPSLVKWALLAVALAGIGVGMLRGGELYSFATRAVLGIAHLTAGALIALATIFGGVLGYSWLELGNAIFAVTVVVNVVGLLGPVVGSWFPGVEIAYVDEFCQSQALGVAHGPAVRATPAKEARKD
jgi:hypothetical protein